MEDNVHRNARLGTSVLISAGWDNYRANVHHAKGYTDRAIADYDKAIQIDPGDADGYFNRGLVYYDKGDFDRAIANYNKVIQLDPDDPDAYIDRGNVYRDKGDFDRAIADYDRAIQIDPGDAVSYVNRGSAYLDKGDPDQAIADYDKGVQINPDIAFAFFGRGLAYRHKGDFDRAIADFDKAIQLDPDNSFAYDSRGYANFYKGDFEASAADLRRSGQSGDVYGVLWLFIAQTHAGQNAASELTASAASLQSKEWPYPVVELYRGRRSADAVFAKAGSNDERCEAYFYIGEWHLMQGRHDEAIPALRSAVETCPKNFIEYSGAVAELGRIE